MNPQQPIDIGGIEEQERGIEKQEHRLHMCAALLVREGFKPYQNPEHTLSMRIPVENKTDFTEVSCVMIRVPYEDDVVVYELLLIQQNGMPAYIDKLGYSDVNRFTKAEEVVEELRRLRKSD